MDDFLRDSNLLHDNQHGFRAGKSIDTAISSVLHFVHNKVAENKVVMIISLDIHKAFDTVHHKLLLQKLYALGFRGIAYQWLVSYFSDRKQYVEIEHFDESLSTIKRFQSDLANVTSGTFQGTIMGPDFFNYNFNDFFFNFQNTESLHFSGYADDAPICIAAENLTELFQVGNIILSEASAWFGDNQQDLSKNKCDYIIINSKCTDQHHLFTLSLDSVILKEIQEWKYVGVIIDNQLNWSSHISALAKKLSKCCYLLTIVRHEVSIKYLLVLYYSYFFSNLRYGIIFWGHSSRIKEILILQKRCLRIIFRKKPTESCRPLFLNNEILTVINLSIFERCIYIYNNPERYKRNQDIHSHNTRNKCNINTSVINNKWDLEDLQIYNHLPYELKQLTSAKQFKTRVKKLLVSHPFYTFQEYLDFKFYI